MEDSLDNLNKVEHIFLTEIFEKKCPYFIAIGMTYDQFWRDDPTIALAYKKSNKLLQEINKWNNWEEGMYTYEALCKVSPVLHAFAKKGTKPLPFSEEPYGLKQLRGEKEEKEEIIEEQQIQNERMKAQIFFNNWFRSANNHFKKEAGE